MSQPLYPQSARGVSVPQGCWRAVVVDVAPLTVQIPSLTGTVESIPDCEQAVFTPPLAVGDRVWVMTVEGDPELWAVLARRT